MTDPSDPPKTGDTTWQSSTGTAADSGFPIHWLRQTSPYINTHRGRTFVVWFSGAMIESPNFTTLIHDLTLLSHLGVKLVLAHGLRTQIDDELSRRQIHPQFGTDPHSNQNRRITTTESLPAIAAVTGEVRCKLESAFSTGLPNSPMSGAQISLATGNLIVARPYGIRNGVDYQHTGEIRKLRVQRIHALLNADMVVSLSPVGYSPTGEIFNLLSEDVAMQAAIALGADKLIYLHDDAASIDRNLHELLANDQREASKLLPGKQDPSSIAGVIDRAKYACQQGVGRCHIVDATDSDALLQELFTRDGSGLLIDRGDYDNIRAADTNCVNGILELIKPLMTDGTLVMRTEQDLERQIDDFYVIEREGSVICCASLHFFTAANPTDSDVAELACLAVHPDFRASGKAADMLNYLIKVAKQQRCHKLFSLSTRTGDWFLEHGFAEDNTDLLQTLKKSDYPRTNPRGSRLYSMAI